jgi:cob(I)alamin adenosyltransferase
MAYFQVYTGDGKGKTTAAFGLALRAAGRGKRVFIGQFLKHEASGEVLACASLPGVRVEFFGVARRVGDAMRVEDADAARAGLARAKCLLAEGNYDLVILDELNYAAFKDLVDIGMILDLVRSRPDTCELVVTGRNAPPRLLDEADLVTEMREIKHYARSGVAAREGIEL